MHTLGPWFYSGDSLTHRQFDVYAPNSSPKQHVCTINNLSVEKLWLRDADQAQANARLIAAAPDMFAALVGMVQAMRKALPHLPADHEAVFCGEWLDEANAAILKAKGEA